MAVTQISRIQHRRGLEQDLPQLASAELGWSIDTRQLYIGNGTIDEGAPIVGVTRILTENDIGQITSNTSFVNYTFVGAAAGYTAQTGSSGLSPVVRTYQEKFDDVINVRDFGAVGDDSTDDTAAINRALQQIYKSTVSPTEARARRTVYFPGGSYKISSSLQIPTYAKIIGDGISSTIIRCTNGNVAVANICDSSFQTGSLIGTSSAILPEGIEIQGVNFFNSNAAATVAVFQIDSATNVKISSCSFQSNAVAPYYPNVVSILSTNSTSSRVSFDNCKFIGGGNGLTLDNLVNSVRVFNSSFLAQANVPAHLGSSTGYVGVGNFIDSNKTPLFFGNSLSVLVNDTSTNSALNILTSGIFLGNLQMSPTQQFSLSTTPFVISLISNSGVHTNYEVIANDNKRRGVFKYVTTASGSVFDDEYVETSASVNANLFANSDSFIASVTSGTAIIKFNNIRFI
jgi:hypothetical protein